MSSSVIIGLPKLQHLSTIQVRCTPPSMLSIAFMRGDDPGISGRLSVSVAMPSAISQRTGLDMDAPEISFGCASASEECRGRTNEKGSITSEIYSAESATWTMSDLQTRSPGSRKIRADCLGFSTSASRIAARHPIFARGACLRHARRVRTEPHAPKRMNTELRARGKAFQNAERHRRHAHTQRAVLPRMA